MLRLLVVIPVYAFVAIFLPRQDWFLPLGDAFRRIGPDISIIISITSLVAVGAAYFLLRRFGLMWMASKPRLAQIVLMGFLGVFIAAVFDVFERMSGYATDIISLIVIPIAFMIAEAVYSALQWRLNRN